MRSILVDAPLEVSTDGLAGPYIVVTPQQMKPVADALRARGIHFEPDDDTVILDGRPALSVIDLGQNADVEQVQGVLDGLVSQRQDKNGHQKPAEAAQSEVIVRFKPSDSSEVRRRLAASLPDGWRRSPEIDERMRQMSDERAGQYCFIKNFAPMLADVAVWLTFRGVDELYVSPVIALKSRRSMDVDQYNHVLDDFKRTFIEPLMRGLRRHVFNYQAHREPTLEDVLSIDSMRRLKAFSTTANKEMLHKKDKQLWQVFIARTHLENTVVEPSLLSEWLEDEGWPVEERSRLIGDYSFGRSLLTTYEEERDDR